MIFTYLLDAYLDAKKALDEAKDGYEGYSFGYFHEAEISREYEARTALDEFMSTKLEKAS